MVSKRALTNASIFLLALFVLLEIAGTTLNFYNLHPGFDIVMHFLGGALLASLSVNFLAKHLKHYSYPVNIFFTTGIGAFWEIIEFFIDLLFGYMTQPSLRDTIVDLIMVFLAAIVVNLIHYLKMPKN